ncbi:hypothetical protein [Streptomyces sioyaensis]|uniref:hypothetical protein n=1 Tax=Streptomyces sioyaensis TaxID=67364 RepID=UPI0037BC61CB
MSDPRPDPDWLFEADAERRSSQADEADRNTAAMADAADSLRETAEYLRDLTTPAAPPKEKSYSLDWFFNWLHHQPFGKALKWAAVTTGPAGAILLWYYTNDQGQTSGAGMAFLLLLLAGGIHLKGRTPFTRALLMGTVLAPIYYFPTLVTAVFGIATILTGGAK